MLCNCCEHRRRNIEDKQKKVPNPHQPRCECGCTMSVSGCYMWRPMLMPVFKTEKGDKRPVGGPWMIAARIRAERLVDHEDTVCEIIPVGAKKNREYCIVRRLMTKDEKKASKLARKRDLADQKRWQRQFRKMLKGKKS